MTSGDLQGNDVSYRLRQRLAVIVGEAERLLESDLGPLTDDQRAAIEAIEREGYELAGVVESGLEPAPVEDESTVAPTDPLLDPTVTAEPAVADPVDRILTLSTRPLFTDLLERETVPASVDVVVASDIETAVDALEAGGVDRLVVDAAFDGQRGLGVLQRLYDELDVEPVPFGLCSVFDGPTGLPRIALSGVLSPDASPATLEQALGEAVGQSMPADGGEGAGGVQPVDAGALTVACLGDGAAEAVGEQLEAVCVSLGDPSNLHTDAVARSLEGTDAPDLIVVDRDAYGQLTPASLETLRGIETGAFRPLLLVDSTAEDPHGRHWIPVLGGLTHRCRPVDPVALLGNVLVAGSDEPTISSDDRPNRGVDG